MGGAEESESDLGVKGGSARHLEPEVGSQQKLGLAGPAVLPPSASLGPDQSWLEQPVPYSAVPCLLISDSAFQSPSAAHSTLRATVLLEMSWTERFAVAVVVLPGPAPPLDLAQQILERPVVLESGYSCASAVPASVVPALAVPALAVPALAVPALAVLGLAVLALIAFEFAGQSSAVLAYAGRPLVVPTLAARPWTELALAAPALIVSCLGLAKPTLTAQHR